jgi:hypothetical protein
VSLRVVRAFVWMRWRVFRHAFDGAKSHDALEQASRVLGSLLPVMLAVLLLPSAIGLAVVGFLAGRYLATAEGHTVGMALVAGRFGLFLVAVMVVLAPLVRSARGSAAASTRLLLLPVRRATLHLSEVVAGLTDPWLGLLVPFIVLFTAGLLVAGRPLTALIALIAGLLLLAVFALIASSCGFLIALLYRNRRRAEWVTMVAMTLLSMSGLLFVAIPDEQWESGEKQVGQAFEGDERRSVDPSTRLDRSLPSWTRALPSELYAHAAGDAIGGRYGSAALSLGGLALWGVVLHGVSRRAYTRLLETPESSSKRVRRGSSAAAPRRPLGGSVTAGIALAQIRSVLRTVRGKMAVYLNFLMLGLMYLIFARRFGWDGADLPGGLGAGMLMALAGFLFSMLSLQPVLFNQFAVDQAGLTLQFLAPVSPGQLARGKILAAATLTAVATGLCIVISLFVAPGGHPLLWLSLAPLMLSSFALSGPVATLTSVLLPKTADLTRMGRPGNPHSLAGFVGVAVVGLTTLPGAGLAAAGALILDSPAAALLLTTVWLLLTVPVSIWLERLAARALVRRWETLLLVANGR